jgi:hypothetical protein
MPAASERKSVPVIEAADADQWFGSGTPLLSKGLSSNRPEPVAVELKKNVPA